MYSVTQGIPVTERFLQPQEARETLARLYIKHPGEFFMIEDSDEAGFVVTWVPSAYVAYFIGQCMAHAITGESWED